MGADFGRTAVLVLDDGETHRGTVHGVADATPAAPRDTLPAGPRRLRPPPLQLLPTVTMRAVLSVAGLAGILALGLNATGVVVRFHPAAVAAAEVLGGPILLYGLVGLAALAARR